jgi:hypothetical protein
VQPGFEVELNASDLRVGVPSFCRCYRGLNCESTASPKRLKRSVETGDAQRQDVEKAGLLPTHARSLEVTVNDVRARPFDRTGPHGQPTVPRGLIPDPGPTVLHVADQLGERVADGRVPGPHALERIQHRADVVRQECPLVVVHPGLGPRRVLGIQQMGKGIEGLAEMIVVQRLPHPRNVGVHHLPDPGSAIAQDLPDGDPLPAGLLDGLSDADCQLLGRAQPADIAAGEDPAQSGFLGRRCYRGQVLHYHICAVDFTPWLDHCA